MNQLEKIIYGIIGNEKGITHIIIKYFYLETAMDNQLESIDITNMLGIDNCKNDITWIDNEHFYINLERPCIVIYKASINKISVLCENINIFDMGFDGLYAIIILNEILIFCGFDSYDDSLIVKYNYKTKKICYTITFGIDAYCVSKVCNEIIAMGNKYIYKYDYYNGKEIMAKNMKFYCINRIIIEDNIICIDDKNTCYVVDLKSLNVKKTFCVGKNKYICYDYNNNNIIFSNKYGKGYIADYDNNQKYIIYNTYNQLVKECAYPFSSDIKTSHYSINKCSDVININYQHRSVIYDSYTHQIIKVIHYNDLLYGENKSVNVPPAKITNVIPSPNYRRIICCTSRNTIHLIQ